MRKGGTKLTSNEVKTYVVEYFDSGNYNAVARKYDKNPATIRYAVDKFREDYPDEYNKIYSNYLQKSEEQFITKTTSLITKISDRIEEEVENGDCSIAQLSTTLGIMYDKRQLSMGKSTNNSAIVIQMSDDIKDLAK